MADFSHLWNDLPFEERMRLMPCQIESQILHLTQARNVIVRSHKRTLAEMDDWIKNLERDLKKYPSPTPPVTEEEG